MRFFSSVPYRFAPIDVTVNPETPENVCLIKGTFAFDHRKVAWPVEPSEQVDFVGDTPFMDEIGRSLRLATDLAPFKPHGEITLTAECCVPGGAASREEICWFEAGPIQKRLIVCGDRVWLPTSDGQFRIDGPLPFSRMPLRWERAFGGLSHPDNPFGRGIDSQTDADGKRRLYLPNIEAADRRVRTRDDRPSPAGFSPVSPVSASRLAFQGTRDQHWATFRAPLPPADYDARAEQAAPPDQWLRGYWTGDETIRLGGMDPAIAVIETRLPGVRPRLFFDLLRGEGRQFVEIPVVLDTVHVDVGKRQIFLTWRRAVRLETRDGSEIDAIYLTQERVGDEPRGLRHHHRDYLELRGPDPEPRELQLARDEAAAVAEARKTLQSAGVDQAVLDAFDAAKTSRAKYELVFDLMRSKTAELEAMTRGLR
jgi:hypothetical protein